MKNTNRLIICALLSSVSLALFAVELLIPPFPFCPAAKIGLANVVNLFMLTNSKSFRTGDVFMVLVCRCVLAALVTGRFMSVLFSLSGGIAAVVAMLAVRFLLGEKNVVCISIAGAVFHNLVQILVAVLIYGVFSAFYYIPSMFIAGVLCGVLTGLCVKFINRINIDKRFFN